MTVARAPRALNAAFGEGSSLSTLDPYAAQVAGTVCRRVDDFDRLYESALATLPFDAIWRSARDARKRAACEPYLRVAFPHGLPEAGRVTVRQRATADAAFDRDELWATPTDRGRKPCGTSACPSTARGGARRANCPPPP